MINDLKIACNDERGGCWHFFSKKRFFGTKYYIIDPYFKILLETKEKDHWQDRCNQMIKTFELELMPLTDLMSVAIKLKLDKMKRIPLKGRDCVFYCNKSCKN